ncbi:protein FAM228B isoform X2 [Tyto alba]|uniref:protein FAM228B isoform X2 n=1 Tax=Tyto alba TaxID=56313 RepID=UPI001C684080|nr:protein FAM228B isoform X2 [Tyto alba]XP_042659327.1 protein FAM228B isoform X2 [Tyto alba]XP_042659329.1 protein FAM228B isoform X2 [Tyto alba]
MSQKNKTALSERKSTNDGLKQEPVAPLQTSPTMCSVNSSETPWLLRFTCPRAVREHDQQRPWQVAPDESRDIVASAQCILDRENYFVREVDRYLRHNDYLNLRKKEILYKKWLEDVSEPLLQKIEDKMDSQSNEEIRKRKEQQLSLYLNYCKKKGYVALEVYDPSEYDPFFLKTCTDCWKVSIPTLQDPLLEDIQRKIIETGIIKQCETGILKQLVSLGSVSSWGTILACDSRCSHEALVTFLPGRPCSARELHELSKAELPLLPLSRQRMDAAEWLKIPHAYIASEVHQTKRLITGRQHNSYSG